MTRYKHDEHQQTFSFTAPAALSVLLVGDFTHWQEEPVPLHRESDGVWRVTVGLSPGTHQYRFLVDGQWRDDPACELKVPNPHGGRNAVREVHA